MDILLVQLIAWNSRTEVVTIMCILLNISVYFRKALDLRARSSRNKPEWGNSFFRFTLKENSWKSIILEVGERKTWDTVNGNKPLQKKKKFCNIPYFSKIILKCFLFMFEKKSTKFVENLYLISKCCSEVFYYHRIF